MNKVKIICPNCSTKGEVITSRGRGVKECIKCGRMLHIDERTETVKMIFGFDGRQK